MNTYKIIDAQVHGIVAENQTLADLRMFANDLFWQDDDIDFSESNFETVKSAINGCDYDLEFEV